LSRGLCDSFLLVRQFEVFGIPGSWQRYFLKGNERVKVKRWKKDSDQHQKNIMSRDIL